MWFPVCHNNYMYGRRNVNGFLVMYSRKREIEQDWTRAVVSCLESAFAISCYLFISILHAYYTVQHAF